jgi:ABC-type bacteriocin/lantibiotic exporter with double-glycine peptidase domain
MELKIMFKILWSIKIRLRRLSVIFIAIWRWIWRTVELKINKKIIKCLIRVCKNIEILRNITQIKSIKKLNNFYNNVNNSLKKYNKSQR